MKKIMILYVCLLMLACSKPGEFTSPESVANIISNGTRIKSGTFNPTSGISGAGMVNIYSENGNRRLVLENYTIEEGPDLKVYLSATNTPTDFVNLGNVNPATTYLIPDQIDLNYYNHVLIHCQQYNHLFAVAELTN